MSKVPSEYYFEVLLKEYEQVSQGVRALLLFGERLLALGVAIMTLGLAYGFKERINEILLFQPIVNSAVLLYAAHIYAELRAMAGYKRFLEEKINQAIVENTLLWEGVLARARHRAVGQKLLYLIYLTLYGVSVQTSLRIAWSFGRATFIFILSIITVLFIGVIIAYIEMYKALNSTYNSAQNAPALENLSEPKVIIDPPVDASFQKETK